MGLGFWVKDFGVVFRFLLRVLALEFWVLAVGFVFWV